MVIKNPHMATLHHHPHLPRTGTATLHPRTASQPMEVMLPMINNYFSLLTWFIVIALMLLLCTFSREKKIEE